MGFSLRSSQDSLMHLTSWTGFLQRNWRVLGALKPKTVSVVRVASAIVFDEVDKLEPGEQFVCKPGYEDQSGSTFCKPPSLELLFLLLANKSVTHPIPI